jgi:hypothetical protein
VKKGKMAVKRLSAPTKVFAAGGKKSGNDDQPRKIGGGKQPGGLSKKAKKLKGVMV